MVLGFPEEEWPWLYIDPDTCIDCGACIPECPYEAIFPEEEVPFDYKGEVWITNTKDLLPDGAPFEGEVDGHFVKLLNAKQLDGSEEMDLTEDIPPIGQSQLASRTRTAHCCGRRLGRPRSPGIALCRQRP
jgi:ferredoxin